MPKYHKLLLSCIACLIVFFFSGCASMPNGAKPVTDFSVDRYLGTWYELARLDFKFEKDLDNTVAHYSLDKKGNMRVLNSGYHVVQKKWRKAEGVANFRNSTEVAALKVSFFGPFYGGYTILALDDNYQYALVAGNNLDYLWLLSRTKDIPATIKSAYLEMAEGLGYDTKQLIWVRHDKDNNPFLNEK